MPRRLCVVIGPFIGWKSGLGMIVGSTGMVNGPGFFTIEPSGLPRSQARLSKSPKMWQLAQAESPCDDVLRASYRKRRPLVRLTGSGLYILTCPVSCLVLAVDRGDAVVEARQHVGKAARAVQHDARGAAARELHVIATEGTKLSFSSSAVLKTPSLSEPSAATYRY